MSVMEPVTTLLQSCSWELMIKVIFSFICVKVAGGDYTVASQRHTEYGEITGYVKEVLPETYVELYTGVPYVKKPTGDLRFEYPQPPDPWTTPLNVTSLPPACPQISWSYVHKYSPDFLTTSEDCLYMNIYVPQTDSKGLSVMFWVHGGSNEVGMGAMLPGEVLAAHAGIIVVTINYRLATLGFLHMENKDFPGNIGIADQMAALLWIHRNIKYFDGDPDKVTIAGHSAGAVDASVLLMNPELKGMFRHAIVMSGSPMSYWATIPEQLKATYATEVENYLRRLGCTEPARVKQCLKTKTTIQITRTNFKLLHLLLLPHPVVIDNYMLKAPPRDILEGRHGTMDTIPVMVGFTSDEGSLGAAYFYEKREEQFDMEALNNTVDHFNDVTNGFAGLSASVIHEYRDYGNVHNKTEFIRTFSKIEGDISMVVPGVQLAMMLRSSGSGEPVDDNNNVYLYSFEFQSPRSFVTKYPWLVGYTYKTRVHIAGVPHGRDLFYLFGVPLVGHALHNFTQADVDMSKSMMDIWGNFVKHGYPSHQRNGTEFAFKPFTKETNAYIRFLNKGDDAIDIRSEDNYNFRRYAFWTSLVPKLASVCDDRPTKDNIPMNTGSTTSLTVVALVIYIMIGRVIYRCTHDLSHGL